MNTAIIPGTVVVGVDGTPESDVALGWAVDYAQSHHRSLTIVHASGRAKTAGPAPFRNEVAKSQRIVSRRITDRAFARVRELSDSLQASVWTSPGGPHDVLMKAAERATVLVVGTQGRGTLGTLLLGSVSVDLSTHAHCPVVVAREALYREPRAGVVVGVDGTEASAGAIEFAFELASSRQEPLHVAHTVPVVSYGVYTPQFLTYAQRLEIDDDRERQVSESMAGYQEKYPDVVVSRQLVEGNATADLIRLSQHASSVVVGSRGRGEALAILLGSVSRGVVEHAHCTVAVVRRSH